jgi:hypothetical protein
VPFRWLFANCTRHSQQQSTSGWQTSNTVPADRHYFASTTFFAPSKIHFMSICRECRGAVFWFYVFTLRHRLKDYSYSFWSARLSLTEWSAGDCHSIFCFAAYKLPFKSEQLIFLSTTIVHPDYEQLTMWHFKPCLAIRCFLNPSVSHKKSI